MEEWWQKHFDLLIEVGVTKELLEKAGQSERMVLRDGVKELFTYAHENHIPIFVFSASMVEILESKLRKDNILFPNVNIISNQFIFNIEGIAVGVSQPLIFAGNKNKIAQSLDTKVHAKTAFVFGDHPSDAYMSLEANHEKIVRFGFANNQNTDLLREFNHIEESSDASIFGFLNIIEDITKSN